MTTQDNPVPEDNRLEDLQENLRDALGETTFGGPTKVIAPGGQTIVFRRRQYEGRPDSSAYELSREEQRKAVTKRSKAMGESWKKFASPGKKSLTERKDNSAKGKFPLAYELVEYVNGGGTIGNVGRMMQLKPPTIHGIEDVADAVDWHLLNRGITVEHLETALSQSGKEILVFMDDRAEPRLAQVKEVLSKFGEPRILQRADGMSETTGQPHGFYVFELSPDNTIYQPRPNEKPNSKDLTWNPETPQPEMVDSLEDDTVEVILEDVFEPFCSTCGEQLFEEDQRAAFKPSSKLADKKWQDKQNVQSKAKTAWKKTDLTAEGVEDSSAFVEAYNSGSYTAQAKLGGSILGGNVGAVVGGAVGAGVGAYKAKKKGKKVWKGALKGGAVGLGTGALVGGVGGHYGAGKAVKFVKKHHPEDWARLKKEAGLADNLDGEDYDFVEGLPAALKKNMSSEAFDAKVGDPKGKKKKDHPSTIGDSIDFGCESCGTTATLIDEHEFSGYHCARHGSRLDKYSRACYECKDDIKFQESITIACPECRSSCSLDESECSVCNTLFEDGVSDYAEYVAETLTPFEIDENVVLPEHTWEDSFSTQLADTLFADVEDDPLPF